ncbi:ABC transporter ATP-binding protein [Streptomyces sp. NBC_00690]|uniref:ABC transporter ATP-binding protein n=1 Tax=Streptomyces sp. NBC_00690 TaxID=2975808 RepID=UPI002E2A7476|nr:ABC transporter ATP-binding protein [Streptomyces sp. NBC_00690]
MTTTAATDSATPAVVEFRSVGMRYGGRPPVVALDACDLTISRGEYVTVVGPSGSGKSTFLNIAGLLDAPTSGRYLLDGIDTGTIKQRQRAALRGTRIGFVFQAFHVLAHRTARENVELAMVYQRVPRRERRIRAEEALRQVGLGHRIDFLPTRMSGGERQRVAIARAVVTRPSLLLCDEPTGNLDSGTTASVLGLLSELHDTGMTLVVITHDAHVAAQGQRTLTMLDGGLKDLSLTEAVR